MTRAELLSVVYWFYPRGLTDTSAGYEDTAPRQRQRDAARRGVDACPTWRAMLSRLRAQYSLMDDTSEHLCAGGWESAYAVCLELPGRLLGFHVSLLGPYYAIHRTGDPGEEAAALHLEREIEATYPGYQPIPPELGDLVVPDVSPFLGVPFGKATIYVCLLSDTWEKSSEPWPPLAFRALEATHARRAEAAAARRRERWRAGLPVAVCVRDGEVDELRDLDDPDAPSRQPPKT